MKVYVVYKLTNYANPIAVSTDYSEAVNYLKKREDNGEIGMWVEEMVIGKIPAEFI